jgi:hypothetical protein
MRRRRASEGFERVPTKSTAHEALTETRLAMDPQIPRDSAIGRPVSRTSRTAR